MKETELSSSYFALDEKTVIEYLSSNSPIRSHLSPDPCKWRVREIGDGNLNQVFLMESGDKSIIAKQALPYIRARGEGHPLPVSRAFFEYQATIRHSEFSGGMTPKIISFDEGMGLLVMEYLSPHIVLRKGLITNQRYPRVANDLGRYLALTLFRSSDLCMNPEAKKQELALFAGNHALCRITENRVFTEPYFDAPLNRWTSPQLDEIVATIRNDAELRIAVCELKAKFMNSAQALLHGDLHTGSVMVTANDTRVIDPEFAFYGPIGFDVGAIIANFLIAYFAQPGYRNHYIDFPEYNEWLLDTIVSIWSVFEQTFRDLWNSERSGSMYSLDMVPSDEFGVSEGALERFVAEVRYDTMGFAGAKIIRRIIGVSHVEDLAGISDKHLRAECEKKALALAIAMIIRRYEFAGISDVAQLARRAMQSDNGNLT